MNERSTSSTKQRRGALSALHVVASLASVASAAAIAVACGGDQGKSAGVSGSMLPQGHTESVEHESCDDKSSDNRVDVLDANRDGKDDIKRVFDKKSGKEVCRITDLNHDGKPDMFEYYDASGQLRRREADYDDSGVVDAIEFYEGGKLARRELDTTGQHRVDTWDYFDPATGKRLRRERDSTNDGRVDQWWTWQGDQVSIAMDKNGDGKPDPNETVVIGANGQAITPADDAGAAGATEAGVASADGGPPAPPAPPPVTPQAGPEIDAGSQPPSTASSASAGADAGAPVTSAKKSGGKK